MLNFGLRRSKLAPPTKMAVAMGLHIFYNAFNVTGTIYIQDFLFRNLSYKSSRFYRYVIKSQKVKWCFIETFEFSRTLFYIMIRNRSTLSNMRSIRKKKEKHGIDWLIISLSFVISLFIMPSTVVHILKIIYC